MTRAEIEAWIAEQPPLTQFGMRHEIARKHGIFVKCGFTVKDATTEAYRYAILLIQRIREVRANQAEYRAHAAS